MFKIFKNKKILILAAALFLMIFSGSFLSLFSIAVFADSIIHTLLLIFGVLFILLFSIIGIYLLEKLLKNIKIIVVIIISEIFITSTFLTFILKICSLFDNNFILAKANLRTVVILLCFYLAILLALFLLYFVEKKKVHISKDSI